MTADLDPSLEFLLKIIMYVFTLFIWKVQHGCRSNDRLLEGDAKNMTVVLCLLSGRWLCQSYDNGCLMKGRVPTISLSFCDRDGRINFCNGMIYKVIIF